MTKTIFAAYLSILMITAGCSLSRIADASPTPAPAPAPASPIAEATPTKPAVSSANTNAGAQAPDAVVRDLYKLHGQDFATNHDRILNVKSRTVIDRFFAKKLADLIWKDLTSHVGEVGALDFDPFYNAQDAEIKNLKVSSPTVSGEKATTVVTFMNYGKAEKLVYSLALENGKWKITDIDYGENFTLMKAFEEADK